jgi:predicted phage tail protein
MQKSKYGLDLFYTKVTVAEKVPVLVIVKILLLPDPSTSIASVKVSSAVILWLTDCPVETTLNTAIPEWNEPKKYTSYIYMRLKYDRDKFQSMPSITIELEGLKIYNPDTAVTEYSNNPALCALDFMTRSSRRGGMGFDIARIDLDTVIDAATYCDTKGWTCDLYLNENQSASDNFLQILATFRGVMVYSESKFKLKYRDLNYESSVMSLTEDDVIEQGVSSLKITQPSIFSTPNAVNCKFTNAEKKFTQDDYVLADSDVIATDGDYREEQIELWGVTSQTNVMKLANYYLERLRINKSVTMAIGSRGMALEPFDLVTLTHSRPGWSAKQLRVVNAAISPEGANLIV